MTEKYKIFQIFQNAPFSLLISQFRLSLIGLLLFAKILKILLYFCLVPSAYPMSAISHGTKYQKFILTQSECSDGVVKRRKLKCVPVAV